MLLQIQKVLLKVSPNFNTPGSKNFNDTLNFSINQQTFFY